MNPLHPPKDGKPPGEQASKEGFTPQPPKTMDLSLESSGSKVGWMMFDVQSLEAYRDFLDGKKGLSNFLTGLWNAKTGKVALKLACPHVVLAEEKGLKKDDKTLEEGWYGFNVTRFKSRHSTSVNPLSMQFGRVPFQHHLKFEESMRSLFSDHFEKVRFFQLDYDRGFSEETIAKLTARHFTPVERSLSNEELLGVQQPSSQTAKETQESSK